MLFNALKWDFKSNKFVAHIDVMRNEQPPNHFEHVLWMGLWLYWLYLVPLRHFLFSAFSPYTSLQLRLSRVWANLPPINLVHPSAVYWWVEVTSLLTITNLDLRLFDATRRSSSTHILQQMVAFHGDDSQSTYRKKSPTKQTQEYW